MKPTKKVLITQSNYIPWKGYFDAINAVDTVVLYDEMQYTRRDWRNRNKIKTPNGLLWLTISVNAKGNYFQKINEVTIKDPTWKEKHWKTICYNYKKAANFDIYKEWLEDLYLNNDDTHLSQINYRFLKGICDQLNIKTTFKWSKDFDIRGDKSEKLLNICKDLNATHYYSGPAAKDYLDETLFNQEGIQVEWLDYSGYTEYSQLFGTFEHGVSILDLLLNEGDQSKKYLKTLEHEQAS